jgi:predicted negative regulator of RcsB-dependent stress response
MAPPAERIKLNRKALREPDEFQTLTGQVGAWAQANATLLVGIAAAVLAVAAVAGGVSWYRARRADAAAAQFRTADAQFQGGHFAEAADAFRTLGRDYGGTPYGRLASLYEGHALARKPDPSGAAAAYSAYLASSPETEYLRQEALQGLGQAREAGGDAKGAQEAYEQAAAIDGPFQTDARVAVARLYEAAGQSDKAREVYLAILKDSPTGSVRALLEAKIPADVAAASAEAH